MFLYTSNCVLQGLLITEKVVSEQWAGAALTRGVQVLALECPYLEKDFYLGAVRGDSVGHEWGRGPTREGWTDTPHACFSGPLLMSLSHVFRDPLLSSGAPCGFCGFQQVH